MTDSARNTRTVLLEVELPEPIAGEAEELHDNEPEALAQLVRYGIMKLQTHRYLRKLSEQRAERPRHG